MREPNLVTIRNANGQLGRVPATYPPLVAGKLQRVDDDGNPSGPAPAPETPGVTDGSSDPVEVPVNLAEAARLEAADEAPAKNASTETWRDYARTRPDSGLSSDEVEAMNRDELVAHFTEEN